jgi:predicted peptidase
MRVSIVVVAIAVIISLLMVGCAPRQPQYRTIRDPAWESELSLPPDTGGELNLIAGKDFPGAKNGLVVYLPGGYDSHDNDYPIIYFLHGHGEIGDSTEYDVLLERVLEYGIPKMIAEGTWSPPHPFIVVAPQAHPETTWLDIFDISAELFRRYRIDETRQYVTGLSMGGKATWDFIGWNGRSLPIAAAVPIAGFLSDDAANDYMSRDGFDHIPIWAFHGAEDEVIDPRESVRLVEMTNADDPEYAARSTIFTDLGHDCWDAVYHSAHDEPTQREWAPFNSSIYEWMLQFRRVKQ